MAYLAMIRAVVPVLRFLANVLENGTGGQNLQEMANLAGHAPVPTAAEPGVTTSSKAVAPEPGAAAGSQVLTAAFVPQDTPGPGSSSSSTATPNPVPGPNSSTTTPEGVCECPVVFATVFNVQTSNKAGKFHKFNDCVGLRKAAAVRSMRQCSAELHQLTPCKLCSNFGN